MSHNLYDQWTHRQFGHASHQRIQQTDILGIYTGIPKSIPKISLPFLLLSYPAFPVTQFFHRTTWAGHLLPYGLRFFNKISCKKLTSTLIVAASTTSYLFVNPKISNHPPLHLIKTFNFFNWHHGYKCSILRVDEVGDILNQQIPGNSFLTMR